MDEMIRSAFESMHMSEDCERKVSHTLRHGSSHKLSYHRICAAAACLAAFVLLLCNPTVADALEGVFHFAIEKIVTVNDQEETIVEYHSPDGKFSDTSVYDKDGNMVFSHGGNNLLVAPEWYVEDGERLYFTANGEHLDITELISMDTPFTYTYTDPGGIIHYICIGGVYDPDPEKSNVGYSEWYYDPNFVDANGNMGHWIGGYADNYWDKETDGDWAWLQKGKQILGVPW